MAPLDVNPNIEEHLPEINARQKGKHYISTEAAMIENSETEKPEIKVDDLGEICSSPFMRCLQVGQNNDGYWNGN